MPNREEIEAEFDRRGLGHLRKRIEEEIERERANNWRQTDQSAASHTKLGLVPRKVG